MSTAAAFGDYVKQCQDLLAQVSATQVSAACDMLEAVYHSGNTVFACGNGGSAANASHFIEDLAKLMWCENTGRRLKAHALTDAGPFVMALANDDGYDRVFEIQLAVQASPGDAVVCISGSGNSPNVLRAVRWANDHGLKTIGFTGYTGGELASLAQTHIHVPSQNMGMLEAVHLAVLDFVGKELRCRGYGVDRSDR